MSLHFIKPDTKIDFVGMRRLAYFFSIALILVGALSFIIKGGPRYGIDFAGGIVVQVKFDKAVELEKVQGALDPLNLPGLIVQGIGSDDNEYLVRTSAADAASADQIKNDTVKALQGALGGTAVAVQRIEMVGPKVGADLRGKALEALYYAVLLIAIYISGRFEQRWMAAALMAGGLFGGIYVLQVAGVPLTWLIVSAVAITLALCWYLKLNYALGAVVALIHDVFITAGAFSLMNKEFDLTTIAALLTILGYSLNDTIIVFDRIRENRVGNEDKPLGQIINESVNQTLSRTVLTSLTVVIVVVSLLVFGGGVIHDFALALLIGLTIGTYSSIFVASPILLEFQGAVPDLLKLKKA